MLGTLTVQHQCELSLFSHLNPVPKKSPVSKQSTRAQLASAKAVWVGNPWESKRAELCSRARTRCLGWVNSNHSNSCSRKLISNLCEEAAQRATPFLSSQGRSEPSSFCQTQLSKASFQEERGM